VRSAQNDGASRSFVHSSTPHAARPVIENGSSQ
jgi:hypothetical protein